KCLHLLPAILSILDTVENCSYDYLLQSLNLSDLPGRDVRPVKDWRTATVVYIDFFLYAVVSLDTSLQTLTTLLWFNMVWKNEFISWDPNDFCQIQRVFVIGETLWRPDLYIYEMTETFSESIDVLYYTITDTGYISYSAPLRIISNCNLSVYRFPFDTQTCTLTFGPYVQPIPDILMLPRQNSTEINQLVKESIVSKGDWTLESINVDNKTLYTYGEYYSQVIYQITMKRAPVVYVINLIIPSCFLVFLDLASMYIPTATNERLSFKITVILGFSVVFLILNSMIPNAKDVPILGIFCGVCFAIMVFSIFTSIATSYMHSFAETKQEVPQWVKIWIMTHLARILCFRLKPTEKDLITIVMDDKNSVLGRKSEAETELQDKSRGTPRKDRASLDVKLLKRLLVEVLKIHQQIVLQTLRNNEESDWHFAARVVDRLALIVYYIIVIIIFAILFGVWAS
uniref:5-hydroxytryptamine receptor 3A n=1 Tax=Leptobrachium leishanense TaxID=445787 RepID=A0A8C5WA90_9ANUR